MNRIYTFLLVAAFVVSSFGFVLAEPNGVLTATPGASTRGTPTTAANHSATAGNVTELTITGNSITQSWQGYFGNASGAIQLADGSGNAMYNWSLASPSGEVFASTSNSVNWTGIDCFNWATYGAALETSFNINDSADGVNETFTAANSHASFYVGSEEFTTGECMSADIFDSAETSTDGNFEEVLLHDGTTTVFASLLEDNMNGFDSASHDFEMLVLEDGHSGDTSTTPYFFYVELE